MGRPGARAVAVFVFGIRAAISGFERGSELGRRDGRADVVLVDHRTGTALGDGLPPDRDLSTALESIIWNCPAPIF